jgi:argininosuccinate lyase
MTERKDNKLWGGRFERPPDARFDAFQRSFAFDRRLLAHEIAVDRVWAKALEPIGIFTASEVKQALSALDKIAERADSDPAWIESFGADVEDVHHFVEKALVEELGPLGWKLHTGRSRNELVATDFRLFVIDAASQIQQGLLTLINALLAQAKAKLGLPMAGMIFCWRTPKDLPATSPVCKTPLQAPTPVPWAREHSQEILLPSIARPSPAT